MANNLKHTWSTSIKNDSGSPVVADPPLIVQGDAESNFSVVVDPAQTVEIDLVVPVVKIQSGFITSNQAVEVFTNAADATGGQHISLAANKAVAWNNQMSTVNPFTPTITKFFITNNGTSQ